MTKTPKILYIITNLRTGGAEKYVLETAVKVSTQGFSTFIAVLGPIDDNFICSLQMKSVPIIQFSTIKVFSIRSVVVIYRLIKYIKSQKIDLIHLNLLGADILGGIASIISNRPFLSTQHNTRPWRYNKNPKDIIYKYMHRFVMFFSSAVITPTKSVKTYLINTTKIKPNKIKVIYHGIDLNKFRGNFKKIDKEVIIGCLATFRPPKGQTYIVDAIPKVISKIKYMKTKFLFAGDGPNKAALFIKTQKLNLSNNVKFLGRIYNVPEFLNKIDILVHAAISSEAFCYAALEALAMGKAVVVTKIDGLPEFIKDHHNGILVPIKSPEAIAKALIELITQPKIFEYISKNAATSVRDYFSINRTIAETTQLYLQILNL